MSLTVQNMIRGILVNDPAVAALVDVRVMPYTADQDQARPYVTYSRSGGGPVNTLSGALDTENATLQLDCWADTIDEAEALARSVHDALDGQGVMLSQTDQHEDPDRGRGRPVYRIVQAWSIWFNRNME